MDKTKNLLIAVPVLAGLLVLVAGFAIADVGIIVAALFIMVACPILIAVILREKGKDEKKE